MYLPENLRHNMRFSLIDGLAYSLMVGFGECYFGAYALERGATDIEASLISTVPLLAGAGTQLVAPWGIRLAGSYRRWAVLLAALQSLGLVALVVVTRMNIAVSTLFLIVSFYWATSLGISPAWNAWMSHLIPVKFRTSYFSMRSRWCHMFTFFGLVGGGMVLQYATRLGWSRQGFFILFALAAIARAVSSWALACQTDSKVHVKDLEKPGFAAMIEGFSKSVLLRLMLFLMLFQVVTNVSSSFFTPYFLRELKLPYGSYMGLLSCALIARFVTLAYAKSLIDYFGLRRLFFISLILVSPLPFYYTQTHSYLGMLVFQAISGVGWGIYEFVSFLIMFNDLPERQRASVLSVFSLLQIVGTVTGSVLGSFIFQSFGSGTLAYHYLFVAGSLMRMLAWAALPGFPWHLVRIKSWIELRPISIRAHGGLLSRPILVRIPIPRRPRAKGKTLPEGTPPP